MRTFAFSIGLAVLLIAALFAPFFVQSPLPLILHEWILLTILFAGLLIRYASNRHWEANRFVTFLFGAILVIGTYLMFPAQTNGVGQLVLKQIDQLEQTGQRLDTLRGSVQFQVAARNQQETRETTLFVSPARAVALTQTPCEPELVVSTTANRVFVRAEPDTDGEIISYVSNNEHVFEMPEPVHNGWKKVHLQSGLVGWISTSVMLYPYKAC